MHLRRRSRFRRMAHLAIFDGPGDITIVASAAKFAIDDLRHVDPVTAGLEHEAQIGVTNLALKANTVKPMGKDRRPHAGGIGKIVDDDVAVFRMGVVKGHEQEQTKPRAHAKFRQHSMSRSVGAESPAGERIRDNLHAHGS